MWTLSSNQNRVGGRVTRSFCVLAALLFAFTAPAGSAITLPSAHEFLSRDTVASGGNLFFQSPEGTVWEFITDVNDPAILNKGQGQFFPISPVDVKNAIAAIQYPVAGLDIDIFILPYPRRGLLQSNASNNVFYLSPGVAPHSVSQIHSLVAHEVGHVVHRELMPDSDTAKWNEYREIRGIQDTNVYHHHAMHRDRPHEIFAEDFRFLYGGTTANYSGSIENPNLALPSQVYGLKPFMNSLSGFAGIVADMPLARQLRVFPNPSRGRINIEFAEDANIIHGQDIPLRVFDVRGRMVAREQVQARDRLTWEGRLEDGSQASPGVYFVEVESTEGRWSGKILVAR